MSDAPEAHVNLPEDATSLRRMPTQKRSRERVERMLTGAAEIISRHGSDALRMSEVAELAGVSIGSLYQFFPDKSAIIQTLAERYNAEGRKCIAEELSGVATMEALCDAFGQLVDTYYAMFLAEPVMRDIHSATQADKALRDMELADSRANAAVLAAALQKVRPTADPAETAASAFLIIHLGESTMRLAISVERAEGDAIVEAYKRMAVAELRRF